MQAQNPSGGRNGRWRECPERVSPDTARQAARDRVAKLLQALVVLGETLGSMDNNGESCSKMGMPTQVNTDSEDGRLRAGISTRRCGRWSKISLKCTRAASHQCGLPFSIPLRRQEKQSAWIHGGWRCVGQRRVVLVPAELQGTPQSSGQGTTQHDASAPSGGWCWSNLNRAIANTPLSSH